MYFDMIRHRHSQKLAATGLILVEFEALLITFKYHWDEYWKLKCVNVYLATGRLVYCFWFRTKRSSYWYI